MGRQVTRRPRERPIADGVDEKDAREDVAADLQGVMNDPQQPFCTCFSKKTGFGFDAHLGVFIHADPKCWRPSKAYYEVALKAGVLAPPIERGTSGDEGSSQGGHRQSVQPSSGDGRDGDAVRRRPRTPRTSRAEVREEPAGQSGEEPGADQTGGGDVLGERSNRPQPAARRVTRRRRDTRALWSDQY